MPTGETVLRTAAAPGALPLIGHALSFGRRPLSFLASLPAHGDLVEIRIGPRPVYVVCDPGLVRRVLHDSRTFDKGGPLMDKARQVVGNGLVTSASEPHSRDRVLVQPAFHRQRIVGYAAVMVQQISEVMSTWQDGQVVAVDELMSETAIRIIAHTMFAADIGAQAAAEVRRSTAVLSAGTFRRTISPTVLLDKVPTRSNRRFEVARGRLDRVIRQIIEAYRRDGLDHADLLSMLLAARDDNGDTLTDEEIRDQVITFTLAGSETTAHLLTWAFHLLGQHPQTRDRLCAEVDTVLDGRQPTYNDLPKLEVTGRILTETMRLYPPVWMSTREVTTKTELAGRVLHPGDTLLYSPYLIHRRADLYPDPDHFDPDRWLPERRATRPAGSYIPFAVGTRRCIGDVFATVEATLVLACVAARWHLQPIPGVPVRPTPRATLRPNTLPMRLHRRCR